MCARKTLFLTTHEIRNREIIHRYYPTTVYLQRFDKDIYSFCQPATEESSGIVSTLVLFFFSSFLARDLCIYLSKY